MSNEIKKSISWEKFDYPDDEDELDDVEEEEDDDEISSYDDGGGDEKNFLNSFKQKTYIPKDMHYNFFVGHTNFELKNSILSKIDTIVGIEAFKILSRYRFLVAFGKHPAFTENSIKGEITKAIC